MAKEKKTSAYKVSGSGRKTSGRKKKGSKSGTLKKELMIFSTVLALITMVILGYYLGRNEASHVSSNGKVLAASMEDNSAMLESLEKVKQQRLAMSKKVEEPPFLHPKKEQQTTPKLQIQISSSKAEASKPIKQPVKKSGLEILDEKLQETTTFSKKIEVSKKIEQPISEIRPKLVIIIDDVTSASQLNKISSIGLKLTPSIFPPYQFAPQNNKLANNLEHYMVHLPMESGKVYDKQAKTLKLTDSKEQMEARIKEIRALFPMARFINNHTGSVFTANTHAMEMIYPMFKEQGFVFVDSRTTGQTAVPKIAKKYGQVYLARDTFIDNVQTINAIHKQLQFAVMMAKKRGYAIAIGHPHKTTLAALGSAKELLKDVDVVYIDELYESIR